VLESIPHTLESVSYAFQGQIFASRAIWAPAPAPPASFEEQYVLISDDRWFGALAPGQSLMLAVGSWLHAPWAISPLLTGLAVALTALLGALLFGRGTGALASLLLLFSPFVLLLAGDMLPQPLGLLLTILLTIGVVLAKGATWQAG